MITDGLIEAIEESRGDIDWAGDFQDIGITIRDGVVVIKIQKVNRHEMSDEARYLAA